MNVKNHISDLLSVDQQKASALILCLILFACIAAYSYIKSGDVTPNMVQLIEFTEGVVAGINIFKKNTVFDSTEKQTNERTNGNEKKEADIK